MSMQQWLKKYKKCCYDLDHTPDSDLKGNFTFSSGSYNGPPLGYFPSILCEKEISPGKLEKYSCLVNTNKHFENEDDASAFSE